MQGTREAREQRRVCRRRARPRHRADVLQPQQMDGRKMRAILLALLCVGCADRMLTACAKSTDCARTEWCVQTWGVQHESAGICAPPCAIDADCDDGTCERVGDGATQLNQPPSFACRQ